MTDIEILEIARAVRRLVSCSSYRRDYSVAQLEAITDYCEARITELEAAEKPEGLVSAFENPKSPKLTQDILNAVGLLTHDLCVANAKTEELERKVEEYCGRQNAMSERIDNIGQHLKAHKHCNGDSGRCYYP